VGAARIAGEAILEAIRADLDGLGGRAHFRCERGWVEFTLLVPPTTWRAAASLFLRSIMSGNIPENALQVAREEVLRSLAGDAGNPAAEAREGMYVTLFGEQHGWSRPACGNLETVAVMNGADVRRAARTRFSAARATASIVGPIRVGEARALFEQVLGDLSLPVILTMPQGTLSPGRRLMDTPTVTAWVGLAFSLGRDPDDESARLLAHLLREAAKPSQARPELVDVQTRIERWGGGGALFVNVITEPQQARRWLERLEQTVRQTIAIGVSPSAFDDLRRRYSGARLLELDTPEARASEAAAQLFFDGIYVDPVRRIEALTPSRLQRTARALGPPATVLLGPANLVGPP
jgi:predicted Zn-dependent peptidase